MLSLKLVNLFTKAMNFLSDHNLKVSDNVC